jgi:hypothetical protein
MPIAKCPLCDKDLFRTYSLANLLNDLPICSLCYYQLDIRLNKFDYQKRTCYFLLDSGVSKKLNFDQDKELKTKLAKLFINQLKFIHKTFNLDFIDYSLETRKNIAKTYPSLSQPSLFFKN